MKWLRPLMAKTHVPRFYQTNEFRELHVKWTHKLKESGFDDIEEDEWLVKKKSVNIYGRCAKDIRESKDIREAKIRYFEALSCKCHEEENFSQLDLTVMVMKSDGISIKEIAKETKIHRQTVRYIIRRYEHKWGIRYWSARQRYLKFG